MKTKLDPTDPLVKKKIKASIADAIAKEVAGSNRDEIGLLVEERYESLLLHAAVVTHIPSLTAGSVRRDVMASAEIDRAALAAATRLG